MVIENRSSSFCCNSPTFESGLYYDKVRTFALKILLKDVDGYQSFL
jgi:hypothetical protein